MNYDHSSPNENRTLSSDDCTVLNSIGTITVTEDPKIILPNDQNDIIFITSLIIVYMFKDDSEKREYDDLVRRKYTLDNLTEKEENIINGIFNIKICTGRVNELDKSDNCEFLFFIDKVNTIKFEDIIIGTNIKDGEAMAIAGVNCKEFDIKYTINGFRSKR